MPNAEAMVAGYKDAKLLTERSIQCKEKDAGME